jgi:hypothetical protein
MKDLKYLAKYFSFCHSKRRAKDDSYRDDECGTQKNDGSIKNCNNKTIISKATLRRDAEVAIGHKIVYSVMDEKDYHMIELFAEMFAKGNPTMFDKVRFRDAGNNAHSKKN